MIPIKYFWCETPTDEDIHEAMNLAKNEDCVVIIKWTKFRFPYSMEVHKDMSFEECKRQIPTVYGM